MTKSELAHLLGIDKFNVVYLDYQTVIEAILEVPGLYAQLIAKRAAIGTAIHWSDVETQGKTKDAKIAQDNMAAIIIKFAHKGVAKARMASNEDLITLMDHELTHITNTTKEKAISLCRDIVQGFVDYPSIFNNITPANIIAMNAAIAAYNAVKTDTPVTIDKRKIEGTQALRKLIKESYEIMQIIYDFVYGEYIDTNKTLVDELAASMTIEIEGVRHTGISATCLGPVPGNNNQIGNLEGVLLNIVELNRTATSNINGHASIIKLKPGTYHVEFSKTSYKTQTMVIYFKRGRTVEIDLTMELE